MSTKSKRGRPSIASILAEKLGAKNQKELFQKVEDIVKGAKDMNSAIAKIHAQVKTDNPFSSVGVRSMIRAAARRRNGSVSGKATPTLHALTAISRGAQKGCKARNPYGRRGKPGKPATTS